MEVLRNNEAKPTNIHKSTFNLRNLRLSLKFRPEILKLVLKMRHRIRKKTRDINVLKQQLKKQISFSASTLNSSTQTENYNTQDAITITCNSENKQFSSIEHQDAFTQTDSLQIDSSVEITASTVDEVKTKEVEISASECPNVVSEKNSGWNLNSKDNEKSIAEQVKEVAQSAMQQSGMVFVESAGMYYDYKTGYYYSAELGLYYHPDTGCYNHFSKDKQTFEFHSYPDQSKTATNPLYEAHEKKKARKLRKARQREETDIDNLTKNLSQGKEDNEEGTEAKRRKKDKKKPDNGESGNTENKTELDVSDKTGEKDDISPEKGEIEKDPDVKEDAGKTEAEDLEEGECSESEDEKEEKLEVAESDDSDASMSTISNDDDTIAKHHPPCMRVILRETNLPKLKVGSLFVVTKDGGTVGREGSSHTILIDDTNVSRNHLVIQYDMSRRIYTITDLGSKNGTTLNGVRISESQIVSQPIEVMHGSTVQLGETKLLCHIHPGIDTCGHCEPGLVMATEEKEKKAAYTRTCSVQKQHQLELARLKNKYAPKPLAIEETAYNDRAKERRDKVGSSHHSEKTQSSDLDTFIEPENKGFKLLQKMGWSKGEGLGKDSQGDTEPIPLVSNDGTSGLGTGAAGAPSIIPKFIPKNTLGSSMMRLAAKTKMLQPPAKAFQDPLDEDSE